ncbi:MAG: B12-binding domain-containing protein [Candidatus Dormibacteria bacterium]
MSSTNWADARNEYFEHLEHPDVQAGAAVVERLLDSGEGIAAVVEEVLRPAQTEVGRRWQSNDWSVADEHAASAVTEAALMVAGMRTQRIDSARGALVLACAPGEWHTIPLRMLSEVLAEAGFACHFLGGSVPPSHLGGYLERVRPLALALTCSSPMCLEGAAAGIVVAHSAGVPVLVGGRGFGTDDYRASMIGADGWTDDPSVAGEVLARWADETPALQSRRCEPEPAMNEDLSALRTEVVARLLAEFPELSSLGAEDWVRTRKDVEVTVGFALIASRFRDDRIFTDFVAWLRTVLAARQVAPAILTASLLAIAGSLSTRHPDASVLVGNAARGEVLAAGFRTM